jgi:MAC/Perforin domain
LERLFEKWGHVVATEVVLGGEHRLLTEAVNVTKHTAEQIQNQLKKHLKAPRRRAEGQETSGSSVIQQEAYFSALSRVSSTYVGGDPRYHSDAQFDQWAQSIENCELAALYVRQKLTNK